ncbi:MAG: DUF4381 domain-containing protein [Alphaproteobacteria bacterium]|nr:DUF4381 domain-containing protein [Alphaproteobacteria bacterium]
MTDNLPELRDIHLPTYDVSAWPPAMGWYWLLAALILAFSVYKVVKFLRRKSAKLYAKHLLGAAENNISGAAQMSEILRRICVYRYPEAVALSGEQWIEFLNGKSKIKMNEKTVNLLQNAPYIPHESAIFTIEDVQNLRKFCLNWIGENL